MSFEPSFPKNFFRSIVDARTQLLRSRTLSLGFEDAFFQSARSRSALSPELFPLRGFGGALRFPALLQRCGQSFSRQFAIERLGAGILDRNGNSRRQMTQGHRRRNLVHVLTPRPAGTSERFLQVSFAQHGI
jgi:hypothetical protein